jgi:iron complex transport system substrate-binding protein
MRLSVHRFTTLLFVLFFLLVPGDVLAAPVPAQRTLIDQLGRSVTLPAKVRRIIPLGGAARYVVYLQAFDLVVGVEAMESRKPPTAGRPYNLAIRKQAEQLPVVGEGRQKPLNLEAIIALRPDLIITAEADCAQADQLSRTTGVPVLVINYGGMGVLQQDKALQALELTGVALGRQERAKQLIQFFTDQQLELARRTRSVSRQPSLYVGAVSQRGHHGITSTDADYYPLDVLRTPHLAQQTGKHGHLHINREQLLLWNPAVIVLDGSGIPLVREDYLRNSEYYQHLAAVRTNRVYRVMPYNNYHTNLELALANSWYIGKILYPQRFRDVDPAHKTDDMCRMFDGFPCYAALFAEFGGYGPLQFEVQK